MKKEWKKHEKEIYLPKTKPEEKIIPSMNYFAIKGKGNPNDDFFKEYIEVLYAVSYAVRMSYKWENPPADYYEYTVYPLEGDWDIADKTKGNEEKIDKNNLIFDLMIRQPEFVTNEFAEKIIEKVKEKKYHKLLEEIEFKSMEEVHCVHMLHLGSYDNEAASFEIMEKYSEENNLKRLSKKHREIYLSDPRKTEESKLKTVLRFEVEKIK